MKRTLILIFFFFAFHFSFAQISLFKDINTLEAGSNPSNFVEANGLVFFTIQTNDGFYLWKTDGTEAGTTQVSEQKIFINYYSGSIVTFPPLYVHNGEIYYRTYNSATNTYELWKTNGSINSLVINSFYALQLISYKNNLFFIKENSLYKIEGNTEVLIKTLPNLILYEKVNILNGEMYFFVIAPPLNGNSILQLWKSNGTEAGTGIVKNIDNIIDIYNSTNRYEAKTILADNQLFFLVSKLRREGIEETPYWDTELWKSDGTDAGTTFVKKILIQNDFNPTVFPKNLTKFNNKVIFNESERLWISDGSEANTQVIKTFQGLYNGTTTDSYGILNNQFVFSALENNDSELWISDGTTLGTQLLKDLNSTGVSFPNHFVNIQDKIFFRANNNDELWQTDGTQTGTVFLQNISKPDGTATYNVINLEFIYTSNNQLFYKNYTSQNGYELWKYENGSSIIVKNIITGNEGSRANDKKVKAGDYWYFDATNYRGTELWKSDGTPNGTMLVKDISAGAASTIIREIVAIDNIIYFTAISGNDNQRRLWRSDGTENGTYEIILSSGLVQNYPVNPELLTVVGTKLFFKGFSNQGYLWVSDGINTRPINNTNISGNLGNLLSVNGKLIFTGERLWISDGTVEGTHEINTGFYDIPLYPVCLLEFNNKVYFFSNYFPSNGNSGGALWESDGTHIGTKIIKEFSNSNDYLTSSTYLFLEKTNNRMYFRVKPSIKSFDLWTSDGTFDGTLKLNTINFNTSSVTLKFGSLTNTFVMFLSSSIGQPIWGWSSDGTVEGTQNFIQRNLMSVGLSSLRVFNNKLHFGFDGNNKGHELWSTDGTSLGTQMVGEVRVGSESSYINGLMDFSDKLLFWGYDNLSGMELRFYDGQICQEECIPFRVIKTKTLNRQ